jgi:tRNA threonylcarbamoyl adenosine modification protein YeaZ
MYLAIDTSTDTASLAIVQEDCVLAELTWYCQQNHSIELMPNIDRLLEQASSNLKALNGIIVAIGPGSFNGLRVGVSTAKGLAFSLGIPLAGISTLEAAAYQYAETGLPICPIFNAGRGEIAAATYQRKKGDWQQVVAEHITTVDSLCSQITGKTVFCGEATQATLEYIKAKLCEKAIIPSPASRLRRAAFLVELGIKRIEAGDHDSPSTLQPIYLRKPPITKPKRVTPIIKTKQQRKE